MLSVTELRVHSSENKSPQKLLWTVIFVSRQVRPGASEQYHVWASKVRTRGLLGFDCPSAKNRFFKGVVRSCTVAASHAGQPTTAARLILWVKRKGFQNACFTICHPSRPIPKTVMDDVRNNFFGNTVRRNLQALNILKLFLWSK